MADNNSQDSSVPPMPPVPPLQNPDEINVPPAPVPPTSDQEPEPVPPTSDQEPEPVPPTPDQEQDYSSDPWAGDNQPPPDYSNNPWGDDNQPPPDYSSDPWGGDNQPPPDSDFDLDNSQSNMDDRFPPPSDEQGPSNEDIIVIDNPDANFDEIFGNENPDPANSNRSQNNQDDYVPESGSENPDLPNSDANGSEVFNVTPSAFNDFKEELGSGQHTVKTSYYDSDTAKKVHSESYNADSLVDFIDNDLDIDDDEKQKLLDSLDENTEYSQKYGKHLIPVAAMQNIMNDFLVSPDAPTKSSSLDQGSVGGKAESNNNPEEVPSTGASDPKDVADQKQKNASAPEDPNQKVTYAGQEPSGSGKLSSKDSGKKAGDFLSGLVSKPFSALGRGMGLQSRDGTASPEKQAEANMENVAAVKSRLDETYKNASEMQHKDSLTNVERNKLQKNLKEFAQMSKDNEDAIFDKGNYASEKEFKDTMKKYKNLGNTVENLKSDDKIDKSSYDEFKDGMKDFMKKVKEVIKKFTNSFSPS